MSKIDLNTLFNYALISVGFPSYEDYLKTVNTRKYDYVIRRQILTFILITKVKGITTIQAGELLKKDHSTIVYSVKKINNLIYINDKETVSLLNDSLNKFKELIKNNLNLENETDLRIVMLLITHAIENGMEVNFEDSLSSIYNNTLNFLSNGQRIHDSTLWNRMVQCPESLFR